MSQLPWQSWLITNWYLLLGGQNNGLSSQIIRQSLRTVVSGRQSVGNGSAANNGIRRNMSSPMDQLGPNGGSLDSSNPNNNNSLMINPQQQQPNQQQMINADMDSSMRFNFDMPQGETYACDWFSQFIDTPRVSVFFLAILKELKGKCATRLFNWTSANIYVTMTMNVKRGLRSFTDEWERQFCSHFLINWILKNFSSFFSLPMTFNPSHFNLSIMPNVHVVDVGTTNVETKLTIPPSTQCWSGGNSNNSRVRRRSVFAFNHVAYPHIFLFYMILI